MMRENQVINILKLKMQTYCRLVTEVLSYREVLILLHSCLILMFK